MPDCLFCKIAKGDIPSRRVWERGAYVGFLDMHPVAPGHTLLVPKKHDDYVFDLPDAEYAALFLEAKRLAKKLKEKTGAKRIGIIVEGFGVPHVHVHLIPINHSNEIISGPKEATTDELEKIAKQING